MKMCARTARVINCVALTAFLLACGSSVAPAIAREDLSAGQTGDPTDGNGITSTSSSASEPTHGSLLAKSDQKAIKWPLPEIVLLVNGLIYRLDIQVFLNSWKRT